VTTLSEQFEVRGDPDILRHVRGEDFADMAAGPERKPKIGISSGTPELDEFMARCNCMFVRFGLSPPFHLRSIAARWALSGKKLERCLSAIELALIQHGAACRSGSGDNLLDEVDRAIRNEAPIDRPPRGIVKNFHPERISPDKWLGPDEGMPQDPGDAGLDISW